MGSALSTACGPITDEKGNECEAEDAYSTADDETYCQDDRAPEDCEALVDSMIDGFVTCADGSITEEELRAEISDELECEKAKATTNGYDECKEWWDNPTCDEDNLPEGDPESCDGCILFDKEDF